MTIASIAALRCNKLSDRRWKLRAPLDPGWPSMGRALKQHELHVGPQSRRTRPSNPGHHSRTWAPHSRGRPMTTLVTGAGLIGTAFAQNALARGETVVFVDPEPRADFLRLKLGEKGYTAVRKDVRDLPGLLETIKSHGAETVVHTAGLIGGRVQQSLSAAFDINLGGTRNVAEAVRLSGVRRLVHISTFGVYDRRRAANA